MAAERERGAEVLVATVDGCRIAFPLDAVIEVQRAVAVEPLAGAPDLVSGLVNLRGEPVPLIDLRRRLGRPPRELVPSDRLLFLEVGRRRVAVAVDRADRLGSVSGATVARVTESVPGADDTVEVAAVADGVLVILDVDRFLTADQLRDLDRAVAAAQDARP